MEIVGQTDRVITDTLPRQGRLRYTQFQAVMPCTQRGLSLIRPPLIWGEPGTALNLPEIPTRRMGHDYQTPVTQCFDGVTTVGGNDGNHAWLCNLRSSIYGYFQFTLDDFVDFFFGMKVLVNRRAGCEFVMRERHTRRVKIASSPSRQPLDDLKTIGIHKRHRKPSLSRDAEVQLAPSEYSSQPGRAATRTGQRQTVKVDRFPIAENTPRTHRLPALNSGAVWHLGRQRA